MWYKCITTLALAALGQTILLADTLDDFAESEHFRANWALVFSPSIFYLGVAGLVVVSRFYRAVHFTSKARRAGTGPLDDNESALLDSVERAKAAAAFRRVSWVTFVDTVFDAALLACGIVFVVLMVDNLSIAQQNLEMAQAGFDDWSFYDASAPLVVLWSLLTLVALVAAARTYSEHSRARRDAGGASASCCFGGDFYADDDERGRQGGDDGEDDGTSINYRTRTGKEKGVYLANANYQQWPCAFMFSCSLSYGWPDLLLAIVLFLFLPAMVLVTLLLASFLNTGAPSMASTFLVLWILEGAAAVLAVLAALWMCSCSWMPVPQPRGRSGYMAKATEFFVVLLVMILLAVQQILIAVRVDDSDPIEWNVVFIPFYILFGLAAFAGCASGFCCLKSNNKAALSTTNPCANDYDGDESGRPPQTSAWGLVGEKKQ
jgi:hypothetical protein